MSDSQTTAVLTHRQYEMLGRPWRIPCDDADTRKLIRLKLLTKANGDYFTTPDGIAARRVWKSEAANAQ